jgi:5-methylcytosine-specific restriction endonuclease McrA
LIDTKLKNFIINILRRASYKWKPRGEARKRCRVKIGEYKTGRAKYGYKCEHCGFIGKSKELQADHINPVVPLSGWDSFDGFIERMFCDEKGFQMLCVTCHDKKTEEEKEERKRLRGLKKK